MPKFLGVISNSSPSPPSHDRVLEFTDLDHLANYLYQETENLSYDFGRQLEFFNEQEVVINDNIDKISQVNDDCQLLIKKTSDIERDTDEVGYWLSRMENSINCMERVPKGCFHCKCTVNLERNQTLDMLVKLCEEVNGIEAQVRAVEDYKKALPVKDPCDLCSRLVPFLDVYTRILVQIDQKMDTLTDHLKLIDEMFINAHKRLTGACYHKPRQEYASDC